MKMDVHVKNPVRTGDTIDMEVKFPWTPEHVPFTASPYDTEAYGRELYEKALKGEFGDIG